MSAADAGRNDAAALVDALNGNPVVLRMPRLLGDCREAYVAAFLARLMRVEGVDTFTLTRAIAADAGAELASILPQLDDTDFACLRYLALTPAADCNRNGPDAGDDAYDVSEALFATEYAGVCLPRAVKILVRLAGFGLVRCWNGGPDQTDRTRWAITDRGRGVVRR